MSSLDDFINALAVGESGGNYQAVNRGSGALGKYQILAGNIGPWSRQYLGVTLTPAQFMASPKLQDSLARAVLGSYVSQYGYRGAASAWYSGNPRLADNYGPQRGGPSIGAYVDGVMSRMGETPNGMAMTQASAVAAPAIDLLDSQSQPEPAAEPAGLSLGDGAGMTAGDTGTGLQVGVGLEAQPQTGLESLTGQPQTAEQGQGAPIPYGTNDKLRLAALQMAQKYLGTPYVYGGTGTGGIDCSALVWRALQSIGINIPRTGRAQAAVGVPAPISQLVPGDLVAFNGGDHVALYVGNNQVIEAARPGTQVSIRSLGTAWDRANNMQGISLSRLYQ